MKRKDADFLISLTLFSNHLKQNSSEPSFSSEMANDQRRENRLMELAKIAPTCGQQFLAQVLCWLNQPELARPDPKRLKVTYHCPWISDTINNVESR